MIDMVVSRKVFPRSKLGWVKDCQARKPRTISAATTHLNIGFYAALVQYQGGTVTAKFQLIMTDLEHKSDAYCNILSKYWLPLSSSN
jgi:hypothetical protein